MNAKRILAGAIYYSPMILALIALVAIMIVTAPVTLPVIGLEKLWDWSNATELKSPQVLTRESAACGITAI